MPLIVKDDIRTEAAALGFADIGFADPSGGATLADRLQAWLAEGHHGDMAWMAERTAWRADPAALWPEAKSVIMLAEDYAPDSDPLRVLECPDKAAISVYAQKLDYHEVVKKRLKRLGRWLIDQAGGEIKVFVDTAPVMEKPLAARAGLGWQGKHTNLVSRRLGSWFFLGAVFTTLDLQADGPHEDRCGGCRQCLDVCPTAAFPAPYQLDARRCVSYLTIELKGPIPHAMRPLIGNRIYGCDDCLAVCPWNKFAQSGNEVYRAAEPGAPDLADLALLDDVAFRERFRKNPIKRIGLPRFLRNILIAMGNSRNIDHLPLIKLHLNHDAALVRGAAVWALGRLAGRDELASEYRSDPDPDVASEWRLALQDRGLTVAPHQPHTQVSRTNNPA